jgi:A/G-specific adenine glycosylase
MNWAGLGYYSRARNLHAAAKIFEKKGFAKSYVQLLEIPGLGPYTARAVASFSFSEAVGVLDGNVIRFLSRYHAQKVEWWKPKDRAQLQSLADEWVIGHDSHDVNQALIEIGATICLPKNPACLICPVMKTCKSFKNKMTSSLPLQKPRRKMEMWMWEPILVTQKGKVAFTNDHGLPVLKKQLALPGPSRKIKGVPKEFDFKHTVTHHQFYVKIKSDKKYAGKEELEWLPLKDITRKSPTSLIKKVVEKSQNLSQKLASPPSAPFKR